MLTAMATGTLISVEDYLATSFEGPDREYVDGELLERPMPDHVHGFCVQVFAVAFAPHFVAKKVSAGGEIRMQTGPGRYRLPDFSVYRYDPLDRYPSTPPFVTVEVISPDQSYPELMKKLEEYRLSGVEHIWVAEPHSRSMRVYDASALRTVERFEVADLGVSITAEQLFDR